MNTIQSINSFLSDRGWLHITDPEEEIRFLAAGEYNANYLITINEIYGQAQHMFRINHGSQLGLDRQIEYEYAVLHALSRSGVTPRPFFCEPEPGYDELGNGVLLMEYLPGVPLDYKKDWQEAASIFARVHGQPVNDALIVQANPVLEIARESDGLIRRFDDHPMQRQKSLLLSYLDTIMDLADKAAPLFRDDPMVMVNTEVNSHNFIISEDDGSKRGWLVDWEKAVVSSRFQDIGHFLVPTTTLWKTDFRFDDEGRKAFVAAYLEAADTDMDLDTAMQCADVMEKTILLRAMSWCFMAYYEYTHSDRALKNNETFAKIQYYMDEMECFFGQNK